LRIPNVLSLLAFNQLTGRVEGMNDLQAQYEAEYGPGDYTPHPAIPYWTFRAMVGSGMAMIAVAGFALVFMVRGGHYEKWPRLLRWMPLAIVLPYLANSSGWLLTEVGRFPWVVFGLLKLDHAASVVVSAGMLWVTLIGYILIYALLIFATIYLMLKFIKTGPAAAEAH
jgi:cytochrome d ubiquinol oxidase subunit I